MSLTNKLIYSMRISIGGVNNGRIGAQAARTFAIPANTATEVLWSLERPVIGTQSVGEQMSGIFTITATGGSTRSIMIDNDIGGTQYFAPLITNRTNQPLLIVTNHRLASEVRCQCTAPAGMTRVQLGYYRLFSNSNVTAFRNGSGYSGPFLFFDGFSASVPLGSGTREFIFNSVP